MVKSVKIRFSAIGFAIILFYLVTQISYFIANVIFVIISPNASLSNPIGINPLILDLVNILIPVLSLLIPIIAFKKFYNLPQKPYILKFCLTNKKNMIFIFGTFILLVIFTVFLARFSNYVLYDILKLNQNSSTNILNFNNFGLAFIKYCIIPAVLEEILFRGMIQSSLLPLGDKFAIVITSIIFALLHKDFSSLISIFILSMFIGYIAIVTNSIVLPILLHFTNNCITFISSYIMNEINPVSALSLIIMLFVLGIFISILSFFSIKKDKIKFVKLKHSNTNIKTTAVLKIAFNTPIFTSAILFSIFIMLFQLFAY